MDEYIERKAALRPFIIDDSGNRIREVDVDNRLVGISIREVKRILREVPAAEVTPVVHGRWEEWWPPKHMILTGEELLYRCSECDAKYSDKENMKFCPNCGARMDGKSCSPSIWCDPCEGYPSVYVKLKDVAKDECGFGDEGERKDGEE